MNNGNYCECCERLGDVQLYIDDHDNAVDLCSRCYETLTTQVSPSLLTDPLGGGGERDGCSSPERSP